MDFTKYVDLIAWRSLWFSRLDRLGDPFEGTYPEENHARFAREAERQVEMLKDLPPEEQQRRINITKGLPSWTSRQNNRCTYVSCWHGNEYESAAMWKLYLKSDEGIAVRSTTRRLADCLAKCPEDILISRVKYIDFGNEAIENDRQVWNTLDGVIHKRISFAHEKEIRAIIYKPDLLSPAEGELTANLERPTPLGYSIGLDLPTLVESVYVHPTATDWFYELVKSVTARFQLAVPIKRSALAEKPIM